MRSHLHVESEKSELTEAESRLVVPEVGGGGGAVGKSGQKAQTSNL